MTNSEIKKPCLNCSEPTDNVYLNGVSLCGKCVNDLINSRTPEPTKAENGLDDNKALEAIKKLKSSLYKGEFALSDCDREYFSKALKIAIVKFGSPKENGLKIFDDREFYELMQTYRHTPMVDQDSVVKAFEAVKAYVFGTPSITKEQLLAILPEIKTHKHLGHRTQDDGEYGWCETCNVTYQGHNPDKENFIIYLLKQRIEELGK